MHEIEVNITNDINYYFEFGYYNLNKILLKQRKPLMKILWWLILKV